MTPAPQFEPDRAQLQKLRAYMACLARSHVSLTSVREGRKAWEVHVLDSLSGLVLPEVGEARRLADLGSGAGFPGVVLAVVLPDTQVDLIESVSRKCVFMQEALTEAGIANARPVCARPEDLARGEGREAYDAVSARAVAPLAALAELASPLLRDGGVLVAWKGARDPEEERAAATIADATAMHPIRVEAVKPFPSSRDRHLHLLVKRGPTPANLPRRAGMARKRPLSAFP